jgi:hypothetical protein
MTAHGDEVRRVSVPDFLLRPSAAPLAHRPGDADPRRQSKSTYALPHPLETARRLFSLWLAICVQAGIVALLLKLTFDTLFPGRPRWHATLFIIALAMLTTVSWMVSNAMPDVFTSIALLSTILILLFWDRLSQAWRFGLFGTIVGSSIMHVTNPPIVLAVLCVGTLLQASRVQREPMRYLMVGAAIIVALGTTLMVSVVGFKQWTSTPNAPPFLLARSLDDGPGKLYLKDHCQ